MTAVSQWEREAIGERTRDAMSHKRNQGERVGNIAYGFRLGGNGYHLEPDPGEQAVLARVRALRSTLSLRRIAAPAQLRRLPHSPGHGMATGVGGPDCQAGDLAAA